MVKSLSVLDRKEKVNLSCFSRKDAFSLVETRKMEYDKTNGLSLSPPAKDVLC